MQYNSAQYNILNCKFSINSIISATALCFDIPSETHIALIYGCIYYGERDNLTALLLDVRYVISRILFTFIFFRYQKPQETSTSLPKAVVLQFSKSCINTIKMSPDHGRCSLWILKWTRIPTGITCKYLFVQRKY